MLRQEQNLQQMKYMLLKFSDIEDLVVTFCAGKMALVEGIYTVVCPSISGLWNVKRMNVVSKQALPELAEVLSRESTKLWK